MAPVGSPLPTTCGTVAPICTRSATPMAPLTTGTSSSLKSLPCQRTVEKATDTTPGGSTLASSSVEKGNVPAVAPGVPIPDVGSTVLLGGVLLCDLLLP